MTARDLRYTGLDPHVLANGRTVTYGDRIATNDLQDNERQRLTASHLAVPIPNDKPKRPRRRTSTDTED